MSTGGGGGPLALHFRFCFSSLAQSDADVVLGIKWERSFKA